MGMTSVDPWVPAPAGFGSSTPNNTSRSQIKAFSDTAYSGKTKVVTDWAGST